jgi:crossover junction endodeoxyribonuclease RuvC
MSASICVLGIDPGFAMCGVGVVQLTAQREHVVGVSVVETKPAGKQSDILTTIDNVRRGRELAGQLNTIIEDVRPIAIAAESMSFPPHASAAAKMAMCWGVLCALSYRYDLPLIQAGPKAIKKAVCGRASASKLDVQQVLSKRYSGAFERFTRDYPQSKHEHGFDAIGAVVACLDSDVIRIARGMAR